MGVTFGESEGNADENRWRISPGAVQTQGTRTLFGEVVLLE